MNRLFSAGLLVCILGTASAADISFIKQIAPILKERCFACHSGAKKSGQYDMGTFEKLLAGGTNGAAIIPGKIPESDVHALMVTTDERRMPPRDKGEAVPAEQSALLAKWIQDGAKLDQEISPKADLVKELRHRWQPPVPAEHYPFPSVVNALAFSPDGQHLATGGTHELLIWNVADGTLKQRIRTRAERAYAILFLSEKEILVAGGRPGQEGDVVLYDRGDGQTAKLDGINHAHVKKQQLIDLDDSVLCLAVSPDGKKIAAGGTDRAVRIWDRKTFQLENTIENHADWVMGVSFSPDGKKLMTAGRDKLAKIWNLEKNEPQQSVLDHQSIVYAAIWKPDASAGFSVGADRSLRMWKVGGDGKQIRSSTGHGNEVFQLAMSPDGKWIVTGSADKTVRIWETEKLANVKTLTGLNDVVYAVAMSPDGKRVAGGAYNGAVGIWTVADGKVVSKFVVKP